MDSVFLGTPQALLLFSVYFPGSAIWPHSLYSVNIAIKQCLATRIAPNYAQY